VILDHNVDYVIHGDDTTLTAEGLDCYAAVKAAGRYKEVPRTTGVSTTDIIRRMLECTKEHHNEGLKGLDDSDKMLPLMSEGHDKHSPYTGVSKFIATGAKIRLFSDGREPKPTDTVVYVDGAFDLFHQGHINVLRKAKEFGTFLIVGIHDDQAVNSYKGVNYPILNVYERVLSVLSCRHCDEVVIGAPLKLEKEFIDGMNIKFVVAGKDPFHYADGSDPYEIPKKMGIYRAVDSESNLTTTLIIDRIRQGRMKYESRNKKKEAKEIANLPQQ